MNTSLLVPHFLLFLVQEHLRRFRTLHQIARRCCVNDKRLSNYQSRHVLTRSRNTKRELTLSCVGPGVISTDSVHRTSRIWLNSFNMWREIFLKFTASLHLCVFIIPFYPRHASSWRRWVVGVRQMQRMAGCGVFFAFCSKQVIHLFTHKLPVISLPRVANKEKKSGTNCLFPLPRYPRQKYTTSYSAT